MSGVAILAHTRLIAAVRMLAMQGWLLTISCVTLALQTGQGHMWVAALLSASIKAIAIPLALSNVIRRIGIRRQMESSLSTAISILLGTLLIGLAFLASPILLGDSSLEAPQTVSVSLSLLLLGLLVMVTHRSAVSQVLGFMLMENGIFLTALSLSLGMPFLVEMGIFFDVLVGVLIMGVFVYKIRTTFDHIDVSALNKLRG